MTFAFGYCCFLLLSIVIDDGIAWPGGKVIKIKPEMLVVERQNPEYVNVITNVRSNDGLDAAIYMKKVTDEIFVNVKPHIKNGDDKYEALQLPPGFKLQNKLCDSYNSDNPGVKRVKTFLVPAPTECPFPVGWFNLTNFKPDPKNFPPLIPTGKYKLVVDWSTEDGSKNFFTIVWYGQITK